MEPTRQLPEGFSTRLSFDLTRDRRLAVLLQVAAALLFLVAGGIFLWAGALLRPDLLPQLATIHLDQRQSLLGLLPSIVFGMIGAVVMHEAVHGLFFLKFTGERPHFGLAAGAAFAGAPEWYLPRRLYLVVGLSPLVALTAAGLLCLVFFPPGWLIGLLFGLTVNASGATGDVWVCWRVARLPEPLLVNDHGTAVTIYAPGSNL